jgi:hypothetical protein
MNAGTGLTLASRLFHLTAVTTIAASAFAGGVIEAVARRVGGDEPTQADVARVFQRLSTSEITDFLSLRS